MRDIAPDRNNVELMGRNAFVVTLLGAVAFCAVCLMVTLS